MEKLFPFSPSELQMILCGDQAPQWTRDDILNYTEPKLGFSKERYVTTEDSIVPVHNPSRMYDWLDSPVQLETMLCTTRLVSLCFQSQLPALRERGVRDVG